LWQEKKPAANRLHPTMKPVELIERALVNSSKGGDCVLDLFGSSGSAQIGQGEAGALVVGVASTAVCSVRIHGCVYRDLAGGSTHADLIALWRRDSISAPFKRFVQYLR
jgi:hypothetical protein